MLEAMSFTVCGTEEQNQAVENPMITCRRRILRKIHISPVKKHTTNRLAGASKPAYGGSHEESSEK